MKYTINADSAPSTVPVTKAECKTIMRIESSETGFDDLLDALITRAVSMLETYLDMAFIARPYTMYFDAVPQFRRYFHWQGVRDGRMSELFGQCDAFEIPVYPLYSVASIKMYDTTETAHSVSTDVYQVDTASRPGRVALKYGQQWPTYVLRAANSVEVKFTAGYTDADAVPQDIKDAIVSVVDYLFNHAGCTAEEAIANSGAWSLVKHYRRTKI